MNNPSAICHPLDDTDPDQCYQVMMAERTALITARQDLENNLIRVIIQLASALIVLMAGFVSEKDLVLVGLAKALFIIALLMLVISIVSGLAEHRFAAKAYLCQQEQVEKYFSKQIAVFSEPDENGWVRVCQLICFLTFTVAIAAVMLLAIIQIGGHTDDNRKQPAATPAATPATTTPAPAPAAATPAAQAATR